MHEVMGGLVDLSPAEGILTVSDRTSWGQPNKLRIPHSRTNIHLAFILSLSHQLWDSFPLEISSADTPSAFKAAVGG